MENLPAVAEAQAPPIEAVLGKVLVRVRPSVFRDQFLHFELPALLTVAEILERTGVVVPSHCTPLCWLNGRELAPEHFGRVRPKPGAIVNIAVLPANQRAALLIGASLFLAVGGALAGPAVAAGLGLAGPAATAVSAGVTAGIPLAGTLALNVQP